MSENYRFDDLVGLVADNPSDKEMIPILAYRGSLSLGRARTLWNLSLAMMLSDSTGADDGWRIWEDMGFSKVVVPPIKPTYMAVNQFLGRLRDNPKVTDRIKYFGEWIASVHPRTSLLTRVSVTSVQRRCAWWRTYKAKPPSLRAPKYDPYETSYPFLAHDAKRPDWGKDLTKTINELVPHSLPREIRADVCQDLAVAVLTGDLSIDEIKGAVKKAVRGVFKMHPMKYGPLSLDAPMPGSDSDRPLHETLLLDKSHEQSHAQWDTETEIDRERFDWYYSTYGDRMATIAKNLSGDHGRCTIKFLDGQPIDEIAEDLALSEHRVEEMLFAVCQKAGDQSGIAYHGSFDITQKGHPAGHFDSPDARLLALG